MTKKLHPSVEQFKGFVKSNPKLIQEVRRGNTTWQELFEDWYLLGEEDSRWDDYRDQKTRAKTDKPKEETSKDWMSSVFGAMKNMDPNQLQGHITNLSQAIGAIQGVISTFQGGSSQSPTSSNQTPQQPSHPFQFRKD